MSKALRVLIIEDVETDAELNVRELKRRGFELQFERVETAEGMSAALEQQEWDIILSDYQMPRFSGTDALKLMQEKGLDLPFIIISGTIGEETAVAAMRAGAHDYLMKGNLTRLSAAIERELGEAEVRRRHRHAETALKRSEAMYRDLYMSSPVAYYSADAHGKIINVNKAGEDFFGYRLEELQRINALDMFADETKEKAKILLKGFKQGIFWKNQEMVFIRKNGEKMYGLFSVNYIRDENSNIMENRSVIVDITERKRAEEEIQKGVVNLRKTLGGTIQAMARTVEVRDPYTAGHQQRVADLARTMAGEMNLPSDLVDGLRMAGTIHDLGKLTVPAEILSKPGKITENEFNLIKTHCQVGHDILKDIEFSWPVAKIVLQHHERMDGSGYPLGISGEAILIEARIIGVADVVEAIASHRPYRPALGIEVALKEISQGRSVIFDPDVVDTCVSLITERGYNLPS